MATSLLLSLLLYSGHPPHELVHTTPDRIESGLEHDGVVQPGDAEAGEDAADDQAVDPEVDPDQRLKAWLGTGGAETWSRHRLNYAAIGPDDAKMQVSFKYRVVRDWDFYLSLTSIIALDLYEDSRPIRDFNLNPELFWRFDEPWDWPLNIDVGYWHISNGQAGTGSRAWDRLFVRGIWQTQLLGRSLVVAPAAYLPFADSRQNPDIGDYHGWWDAGILWHSLINPGADDLDFIVNFVSGKNGVPFDNGSLELGLQYRLQKVKFSPRIYFQYFSGYGDTMLEYDIRKCIWRLGLSF